jgi:hypothetical protein
MSFDTLIVSRSLWARHPYHGAELSANATDQSRFCYQDSWGDLTAEEVMPITWQAFETEGLGIAISTEDEQTPVDKNFFPSCYELYVSI